MDRRIDRWKEERRSRGHSKKKREKEAGLKLKDKAKIVGCIGGIGEKRAWGKG